MRKSAETCLNTKLHHRAKLQTGTNFAELVYKTQRNLSNGKTITAQSLVTQKDHTRIVQTKRKMEILKNNQLQIIQLYDSTSINFKHELKNELIL